MPPRGWQKPQKQIAATAVLLFYCEGCGQDRPSIDFLAFPGSALLVDSCIGCRRRAKGNRNAKRRQPQLILDRRSGMLIRKSDFQLRVMEVLREICRRRNQRRGGMKEMPEEQAVRLRKLPERIASIIGKTYAEQGDACKLADDEAVGMIRDLLLELDPEIIERNKNKKLARTGLQI
jgi:hypothetical protein